MQARRAILKQTGQFDSFEVEEAARRPVSRHEVEIEVEAAALNFKDVLLALGLMPVGDGAAPEFGFECAGTVRSVGSAVAGLVPGDEVAAIGSGCLASFVRVPAETVSRRPHPLSALQAVTMPIAYVTASYALEDLARIGSSDEVLIHAATGGVGLAAIQICRRVGARILATAGNAEKRAFLRTHGIADVMDSRTPAFAGEVLAATGGRGVDVVLNSVSGELLEHSLSVLAPHGRFIELGARSAIAGQQVALSAFSRGASFCAVGYEAPIPRLGARLSAIMARAALGEFEPLPFRCFALERTGDAFAYLASARHIGKVVIAVGTRGGVDLAQRRPSQEGPLLTSVEGVRLFERCLSSGRANLAISKTPLQARIGRTRAARQEPEQLASAPAARHARPALGTGFVPPRTGLETTIAAAWARHFQLETVGVQDDFFELGGDSLLAVQVAHSIRSALGREFPTHLILELPTIASLAASLAGGGSAAETGAEQRSNLLVGLAKGPDGAARPIFLVHPIGGHVYFYLPLAAQLATDAPVYGIQARGVDGEAPPAATIEEMARDYIAAMRTVQPSGPYRLGGSSFGGVVCFEMALQLTAAGEAVELLAMIDSPAPGSLPSFFRSDAEILAYLLARGASTAVHLQALSAMSEDQMLEYFLRKGGSGANLAPSATIDSVRHFLELFRANYEALVRYHPGRYQGRALFFHATQHETFDTQGFGGSWRPFLDTLELLPVPGNHTTMNLPPNCETIVQEIRNLIARIPASLRERSI